MFNTTLFSFLPNTAQIQFFTKLDWKIKKLTLCAAATVGTSSAEPRHLPVNKSNSAYIFSFFFEGTKSLSAILNLQPGIEIHIQLFRRIKLRPFSFLPAFRRRTPMRWKFWHLALLSSNDKTADQSKINSVMSLVEKSVEGQNFHRVVVRWCDGKPRNKVKNGLGLILLVLYDEAKWLISSSESFDVESFKHR